MSQPGSTALRIVVDPGGYSAANIGDTAMLAAVLGRLRRRWPAARIACHTLEPAWLRALDSAAVPLDPGGAHAWNLEGAVAARLGLRPGPCAGVVAGGRRLRRASPGAGRWLARAARRGMGRDPSVVDAYLDDVRRADLVVKAGAGALTDAFAWHAYEALETLALGQRAGAVTALVGQGIGPIDDPALRRRAAEVLAQANLVALRDGAASRVLVDTMGVAGDRIAITGDDALALVVGRPSPAGRDGLGINLRCAGYAGLEPPHVATIGDAVRAQASRGRRPIPLPIDRHADVDDLGAIRRCVAPLALDPGDGPRTPEAFLSAVEPCRAVVTGSYHGAVFALGSGIPVVAISASAYYTHKLTGLVAQFGAACRVVDARHPRFAERLHEAIDAAWAEPEHVRADLRAAAVRQVADAEAAFARLAACVEARRTGL
jgi:polysaccharide pyruvyl transferase WcaK-like protein